MDTDVTDSDLLQDIKEIAKRCSSLPDLDERSPDEILDYNEDGY